MSSRQHRPLGSRLLDFLGSMDLAVTLFVVLAIAAVVGTVLQQNQPYNDYIIKFGPFWFDVFKSLGLFDVYSAGWFMLILVFLVISTTTCIYRNTPTMLRDLRQFREGARDKSLRALHHAASWNVSDQAAFEQTASQILKRSGYRLRVKVTDGVTTIAGLKGSASRIGYIFTHAAIVMICIGGLIDGNVPLKLRELAGNLTVETRNVAIKEIPASAILGTDNPSFRASIDIPESKWTNAAFINMRDGYVVQELPFNILVEDFRIEHYATGQPKSFESDLVVWDPNKPDDKTRKTIEVNYPLKYMGYTIFQSSFSDGGSKLKLSIWPLKTDGAPRRLQGIVKRNLPIQTTAGAMTLELTDFRLFNINPADDPEDPKKVRNFGPSFQTKLRDDAGQAVEMDNYMLPVERDGRLFFMAGVRTDVTEPMRYLYLPADRQGGLDRLMSFLHLMMDRQRISELAWQSADSALSGDSSAPSANAREQIAEAMTRLIGMFAHEGFDGISAIVETEVPEDQRSQVADVYQRVLRHMLATVYQEVLREEGIDTSEGMSQQDADFFNDALMAIATLPYYPSPVFVQLNDFEHIQATGLQITRAPGQDLVYFGSTLLVIGIFAMFYMPHRRLWLRIYPAEQGAEVLLAGAAARNRFDFDKEFAALVSGLSGENPQPPQA